MGVLTMTIDDVVPGRIELRGDADACDAQAIVDAGLHRLVVPEPAGGLGARMAEAAEVLMALGAVDGSTALGFAINFSPPSGELQQLGDLLTIVPVDTYAALPYLVTLIVLAGVVGRSIPPAAVGQPYVKEGKS